MGDLVHVPFGRPVRANANVQAASHPDVAAPLPEHERLWRVIWAECPGIGWQRLRRLETLFGSLAAAWQASGEQLIQGLCGRTRLTALDLQRIEAYRNQLGPEPLSTVISPEQRRRFRRHCLLAGDPALPPTLLELERPPLQLFWQGRGSLWPALRRQQAVAVVGTRRPSRHGEAMARAVGRALAEAGWPVVSGLAEGIDAAAHIGCLEAGGRPVAVLGTPLQRVYPSHHASLQRQVGNSGLLISELPAGTPVRPGHFAQRNRLQVALAQAVVLVECPHHSGALHSAQRAWDLEMPLWVVPGDAARVSAAGSNRWLGRGVSALLEPRDLIESLGAGPLAARAATAGQLAGPVGPLHTREAALLAALGAGASLQQLCERLRQSPGQISERLLNLELAGLVCGEPGLWWRPC